MVTHINYIELYTNNIQATKSFYADAFGWEFTDYGPNYVAFTNAGIEGGFEYTDQKIVNGALVILHHNNLEEIRAKVIESGSEISVDIFSFPGGRRFQFLDPSGNELAVWTQE